MIILVTGFLIGLSLMYFYGKGGSDTFLKPKLDIQQNEVSAKEEGS
jgi:hypothetical protein